MTGDEEMFSEAIRGQKVKDELVPMVKAALKMIFVKVGLRALNWPAEEEKDVLVNHIYANYGNHTLSEILLAFEMAITGKLDLDKKDVVCYENFSCLYFSTIMNSYRDWAKEAYKMTVKEPKMIEHKEDLSDKAMTDWMNEIIERMKGGKYPVEFMPEQLYEWLVKTERLTLSNEQKRQYMDLAIKRREAEIRDHLEGHPNEFEANHDKIEFGLMKEMGFSGKELERLRILAKKMVVYDYLKEKE